MTPIAFYAADPDGFFLDELDGVPVASVSAARYRSGAVLRQASNGPLSTIVS
jgi:hypothetical protein